MLAVFPGPDFGFSRKRDCEFSNKMAGTQKKLQADRLFREIIAVGTGSEPTTGVSSNRRQPPVREQQNEKRPGGPHTQAAL
jgi:hypothetical protein